MVLLDLGAVTPLDADAEPPLEDVVWDEADVMVITLVYVVGTQVEMVMVEIMGGAGTTGEDCAPLEEEATTTVVEDAGADAAAEETGLTVVDVTDVRTPLLVSEAATGQYVV
jgi:hypothetical protein